MSDFNLRLDLREELVDHRSAEALAANLPSFQTAKNGDVVAIDLLYSDVYPGPFRARAASFVIRTATGIAFREYAELSDASRADLADAVMRLEGDDVFAGHVSTCISEMRHREDDEYHHVFIMADAIGIVRPDVAEPWFQNGWCQKRLRKFQFLLPRRAQSAHEAISRHDDLGGLVRLWRLVLERFDKTEDLPCLASPTVGDLLVNFD